MSPRPTVFISAVSKELRSARQLVSNTLTFLGYEPIWQDIFGTESGDLRQMLRTRLIRCKGVVQLVGQCYGAESSTPDPDFGRVSYTQYEALYARKTGNKSLVPFHGQGFSDRSARTGAGGTRAAVGLSKYVQGRTRISSIHSTRVRRWRRGSQTSRRSDPTRRGAKRWAWGVAALLCVIAVLVIWLVRGQGTMTAQLEKGQGARWRKSRNASNHLLRTGDHRKREDARGALPQCSSPGAQRQFLRRSQGVLRIPRFQSGSARSVAELHGHAKIGGG